MATDLIRAVWIYPPSKRWDVNLLATECRGAEERVGVFGITCWSDPPPGRSLCLQRVQIEAAGFGLAATPLPGMEHHWTLVVPSEDQRPTAAAVEQLNAWFYPAS